MKQYRFDYIKEWVDNWNPNIPRTVANMEGLPLDVFLPWIGLDENFKMTVIPARDHYGEYIEDLKEWNKQRDNYIRNLANYYETLQDKGR